MKEIVLASLICLCVAFTGKAFAGDTTCDALSSKLELQQCKYSNKEFTEGLKKGTRPILTDCKLLTPADGCVVKGGKDIGTLVIAPASLDLPDYKWQCDKYLPSGGYFQEGKIGYMMPGYWISDMPGVSNSDRNLKFDSDMKTKNKKVYATIAGSGSDQTCHFYNPKTNVTLIKFLPGSGGGSSSSSKAEDIKDKNPMKKLFGK